MITSYLVTLAEPAALEEAQWLASEMPTTVVAALDPHRSQQIIVQCCPLCRQSFIDQLIADGQVALTDPVVVDIDERSARHIPILEHAGE